MKYFVIDERGASVPTSLRPTPKTEMHLARARAEDAPNTWLHRPGDGYHMVPSAPAVVYRDLWHNRVVWSTRAIFAHIADLYTEAGIDLVAHYAAAFPHEPPLDMDALGDTASCMHAATVNDVRNVVADLSAMIDAHVPEGTLATQLRTLLHVDFLFARYAPADTEARNEDADNADDAPIYHVNTSGAIVNDTGVVRYTAAQIAFLSPKGRAFLAAMHTDDPQLAWEIPGDPLQEGALDILIEQGFVSTRAVRDDEQIHMREMLHQQLDAQLDVLRAWAEARLASATSDVPIPDYQRDDEARAYVAARASVHGTMELTIGGATWSLDYP